jgi:serine protease AprX
VSNIVGSALWGKKDGGTRPRAIVAAVVAAVAALAVPAIAHAGDVPPSLLAQAQSNPSQTFNVIIQTGTGSQTLTGTSSVPPVQVTAQALSAGSQQAFQNALKAAQAASQKLSDIANKVTAAANQVAQLQTQANAAGAKAAQTGSPGDQNAANQVQAQLAQAQANLANLQAQQTALQQSAIQSQLSLIQQQTRYVSAYGQAASDITWQYTIIPAVSASVSGSDVVSLAASPNVVSVTPDTAVASTAGPAGPAPNANSSAHWQDATGTHDWWGSPARKAAQGHTPTIAIVDSGVDPSRIQDFGGRLLGQVNLTSLQPNSPGDGRGHGTMVASIAAGGSQNYPGVDPDAPLISLDVLNDNGEGRVSDVIAACDWILANHNAYNIRVANFSLDTAQDSSFLYDPLSKAVEQLWMNGIVVVAAAGNYAVNGQASGVHYAPASDPFVITVGGLDIGKDGNVSNDVAAPWSSWGYTNDGFLKPDISAPARYIVGACPTGATLCASNQNPSLPAGYVQLSGTSFAAPMVSAAAAALLAIHPDWGPDQVKGWLMLTAYQLPAATPGSAGVGELDMKDALNPGGALGKVTSPPNPNAGLDQYIAQTPAGPVFDAASWSSAAQTNASWDSASWSSASWSSASWSSASWSSASWSSASWSSASWSSASWSSASWSNNAAGLAVANNATSDVSPTG